MATAKFVTNKGPLITIGIGVVGVAYHTYNTYYPCVRDMYLDKYQIAEADGFTVKRIEQAYKRLQENDECKSLLKKHFTEDVKDSLKYKATKLGATLFDVIRIGVENLNTAVGARAADAECYEKFSPLFDPIIEECHGGFAAESKHPASDFGEDRLSELKDLDPEGKFVISTKISCARSVKGFPFSPVLARDDYLRIEDTMKRIFDKFGENNPDLAGTYYRLRDMEKDTEKQHDADNLLFTKNDCLLAQSNHFWPQGRGIFQNQHKTFLAWVNAADHLRIISLQNGGNIAEVFKRLIDGVKAIESDVPFARSERLGWITSSPDNLGTGIQASVFVKLPKLSAKPEFEKLCGDMKLRVQCADDGQNGQPTNGDAIYEISNKTSLGLTEFEAVKQMYDGVKQLIELEEQTNNRK